MSHFKGFHAQIERITMVTMMYVAQFSIRYRFHPLEADGWLRALLSLLTQLLLVLDIGLNSFELVRPPNGKHEIDSSLSQPRTNSASILPIVPLCGAVSMYLSFIYRPGH
jgi:hypothetical protein